MQPKRHFYLTPVLGGPGAPRYPISDHPRLIGRSDRAEIALLEPTVSREHAAVQYREDAVYLEDLGSKHGTFVNSKRISALKLKIGDIIVFGLSLVLRLEESDTPVPMAPALHTGPNSATVSTIEPLPSSASSGGPATRGDRHAETQVTSLSGLQTTQGSRTGRSEEVERLLDQLAKTRKLAAGGALCATVLPDIHQQLVQLGDLLEGGEDITPSSLLEPLRQLQDELAGVLRAVHVPTPELLPTNLFDVLRRAVSEAKPVAAHREVDLLVAVPADLAVLADTPRLEAAFVELLRNAAQASPDGQAVEISATSRQRSVSVTVTNHGASIPESVVARVFDPFFTLRSDRTAVGLGLFEARQLVLAMGGTLGLDSTAGETTATVILRRA